MQVDKIYIVKHGFSGQNTVKNISWKKYILKSSGYMEMNLANSSMFWSYLALLFTYAFSHQNIHFSQVPMSFLTSTHIHIFFTLFRKNTSKKRTKDKFFSNQKNTKYSEEYIPK